MIEIFLVSDGERDSATVPLLVGRIVGVTVRAISRSWSDIRVGGYRRKLRFAIREARDENAQAVIATVDQDTQRRNERLAELRRGREEDRANYPPFPVALGEAVPHAEAWLLDDKVAVRQALGLPPDADIPNAHQVESPKDEIERLRSQSDRAWDRILIVLSDIARRIDPRRCIQGAQTGFSAWEKEVRQELRAVVAGCGDDCRCGDACGRTGPGE